MRWRTRGRALLLALAAMALTTSAWAQVELTFRFNDAEQKELRAALDVFEQENPDIKVTLERVAWADAREQFLREAAVGEGPDVVHIAQVWARSMGEAGVFIPLNELIEEHGLGAGWDDFVSADLATLDDGTISAVPWTIDTFAMVYRKDILEKAGITEFPTTWEDLREASAEIKERTGATGWAFPAGSAATNSIWFFLNFYWWSHGWSLVDRAADGEYVVGITPEQMAEGFAYYKSYFDQDLNPKGMLAITNWGAQELIEGMVRGDMAIISTPEFVLNQIEAAWAARYPDQPNPFASTIHPKESITFVGGRMLGINVNTEHPEEAYRLVQYLIRWPIFAEYYPQWPAQTSLISRIERGPSHAGYPAQLLKARSWGAYSTGPIAIPTMWNWVGRAAGSVFIGEKTPLEAAQEIYDNITAELAKQ
ncbi:MAG: ABC transporter substrate-binding protein [Geminicoccales bacterium]